MSGKSSIEWTGYTWNPVRGCRKISPGCKLCYAERFAERFRGVKGHAYERGFDPRLAPDQLFSPMHWKKPREVFVNSMSDLFLEEFAPFYVAATLGVMACCERHTFQVLTKRADYMESFFADLTVRAEGGNMGRLLREAISLLDAPLHESEVKAMVGLAAIDERDVAVWPLRNVHLGVSVEDRKYGLPRVDHLRRTPAAVRWLSIEPLLEDISTDLDLTGIDWVVVGGESGPGARPFNVEWARKILALCVKLRVPFFMKQLGEFPVKPDDASLPGTPRGLVTLTTKTTKGGSTLDFPEDLRVRQRPGHYERIAA